MSKHERRICTLYHEAPAAAQQDVRTVSVDEITGVQALERAAPDLLVQPGKVARREFEYIRHGTQTVIAAFDVATGQLTASVGDTRTEQDYANFLDTCSPPARRHEVARDRRQSQHACLGKRGASGRPLGYIEDDLGEKATRRRLQRPREKLSRESHRSAFTSRQARFLLNQIDLVLHRVQLLRRASFTSKNI